jgi:hypothetical protein
MSVQRIAPGVYDDDGTVHLFLPEMLAGAGYPDTPENRATLLAAAEKMASWPPDGMVVEVVQ